MPPKKTKQATPKKHKESREAAEIRENKKFNNQAEANLSFLPRYLQELDHLFKHIQFVSFFEGEELEKFIEIARDFVESRTEINCEFFWKSYDGKPCLLSRFSVQKLIEDYNERIIRQMGESY